MKRKNVALLVLVLCAFTGCVKKMQFQGATPADEAACRMEARKVNCEDMGGIACRNFLMNQYNDCMLAKGFTE